MMRGPTDRNPPLAADKPRYDGWWLRAGSLDDRFTAYREAEIAAGREPAGFVYWCSNRDVL